MQAAGVGEDADRRHDLRQRDARDIEEFEQLVVPFAGVHVHQLRARGVAGLDDLLAAEPRDEEGVDRAHAPIAGGSAGAIRVDFVEQPAQFERREHRIERQTRAVAHHGFGACQLVTQSDCALVLPAQERRHGLGVGALPDQRRLALRAQADRQHFGVRSLFETKRDCFLRALPDLVGVLLDPSALRVTLAERRRSLGDNLPLCINEHALGRARPLIDCKNVVIVHDDSAPVICPEAHVPRRRCRYPSGRSVRRGSRHCLLVRSRAGRACASAPGNSVP